jgi:rfaE bifunctional protein kinase chain/domain
VTSGELLRRFKGLRALVIGDLMLDEYIFGKAARISPEAPVIVIRQTSTDRLPGGAANVARNLQALGAETRVLGVIGCDDAGDMLAEALMNQGMDAKNLVRDKERPTTRKTRVVADHSHQVLRIDHEAEESISQPLIDALRLAAAKMVPESDVVVLSDYLKGALTASVAEQVIEIARRSGVPVIVNPKPRSLGQYRGADLVSLNRSEAAEALGMWSGLKDDAATQGARRIQQELGVASVLVTLGESGMVAVGSGEVQVDAPRVEVYDTAGAGDTVIATVALGYASAGFERAVFELAAQTAASVVKHVGVATPSAEDLARMGIEG